MKVEPAGFSGPLDESCEGKTRAYGVFNFPPSKQQELPSAEMGRQLKNRLWGKNQKLQFGHVESDMSSRHPSEKMPRTTGYISSKVQERGQDYNDKSMSHQQINLKQVLAR